MLGTVRPLATSSASADLIQAAFYYVYFINTPNVYKGKSPEMKFRKT